MKRQNLVLFLLLIYCSHCHAQEIHTVVGTKTYFYPDNTPPTIIDSNTVLEYNRSGKLLKENDVEGVCYQTYEYNSLGKFVSTANYCGEGFLECTYTYKGHLIIKNCSSAMTTFHSIDSLNDQGKVVTSLHISKTMSNDASDTTVEIIKYTSYYTYDKNGNETSRTDKDEKDKMYFLLKKNYNEKGLLSLITSYDGEMSPDDSTIFIYDELNRLIHANKFSYLNLDRSYLINHEINIKYHHSALKKFVSDDFIFNDSLINSSPPFPYYEFEVRQSHQPMSIHYMVKSENTSRKYLERDVLFTYDYATGGRLTQIKATGVFDENKKLNLDHRITYEQNDKAILECYGDDFMGYSVKGNIYEYNNRLLIRFSEKDMDGFVYTVTTYVYDFYK